MAKESPNPKPHLDPIEMRRLIPLREAARLRGVSVDTIRRRMRDKIRPLSPGRLGMTVADALSTD
jgi:hypothetical protein